MKKRHLILLGLAGLLLAGCFHTPKTGTGVTSTTPVTTTLPDEQEPASEASGEAVEEEAITVSYTDSGFVPNSITVNSGTSVTFVNESTKKMWVASAVHPTHQVLPGFNQLAATEAGTSYTYTFSKAGQWRYHNHVATTDTGAVIVE